MNDDESATATDVVAASSRARGGAAPARLAGDRYVVGDAIGRGGMGEVLAARDEQIGRDVAIKRIRVDAPNDRHIERFLREARIQGRLEHPAIVPVHEVGRDAHGLPFFAMKKLSGTTLAHILGASERDPKWGRQRLLRAFVDVCLAVEFAHVHGVLHRDLKPSNIMLGEFGEVYVLDWGVAKVVGADDVVGDVSSDKGLTAAGAMVGTPGYMPPEQAQGGDVDDRADVYALGRVLDDILEAEAVPELEAIAKRATALDRSMRLASARELADHVQRFLDGDRDLALRRELARGHLERARAALTGVADENDGRRAAIEEAGRALALDPSLDEASQLITGLLLQPPRTVPVEVEHALADDARQWSLRRARVGLRVQPAFLLGAVTLIAAGHNEYLVPLFAALAVLVVFDVLIVRRRIQPPPWALPLMIAPMLAVVAHVYSPLVVAPALASVVALNLALDPNLRRTRDLVPLLAILIATVLVPLAAERFGLIPATIISTPDGLLLRAPGLLSGAAQDAVFAAFVIVVLSSAVGFGRMLAVHERGLRARLHTISWHLRHLAPAIR